jgi:AraC-like DNA-binding protein
LADTRRTGAAAGGEAVPANLPGRATQERIAHRVLAICQRTPNSAETVLRQFGYRPDVGHFLEHILPTLPEERLWQICSSFTVALSDAEGRAAGRAPFRSSDWRVLFYCLLGSRNLREALFRFDDVFEAVDGRFGSLALSRRDGHAVLTISGQRSPDPEAAFVVLLNGLVMYHSLLSWAIGQPLGHLAEFDFPERMRELADPELLPFELAFDCKNTALLFNPALLQAPIVRSVEDVDRLPSLNPAMQMARGETSVDLTARLRRMLQARLRRQHVLLSLEECAAIHGISTATMRRRLHRSGASFRSMRDDVRRAVAVDLLSDPHISIEDVATRLDFCDSDALRLATQKWVGLSPSEYRKLLLQGGAAS